MTRVVACTREDATALALGSLLRREPCVFVRVHEPAEALALVRASRRVGVVLADFRGGEGAELLAGLARRRPNVVRVLLATERAPGVAAALNGGTCFRAVDPASNPAIQREILRDALAEHVRRADHRRLAVMARLQARSAARSAAVVELEHLVEAERLAASEQRVRVLALGLLRTIAALSEGSDPDRGTRAERRADVAAGLGREAGLGAGDLESLHLAAWLLDIGRTPAVEALAVARAPALTSCERGARLMEALKLPPAAVSAVRHAEERWDGRGGPGGLRGMEIPLLARLVAVAASWVELSARYEDTADALAVLERSSRKVHDPEIVELLAGPLRAAAGDELAEAEEQAVGASAW